MSQVICLMFTALLSLSMIVTCSCAPVHDQLNSTSGHNKTTENKTVEFFCASTKLKNVISELIQVATYSQFIQ